MHKQPLSAFLAAIVFILVLLLDVACQPAAGQESVATPYDAERVREIDTARWVGIGEYYRQLQKAPEPERVSLLATARYTGQALQQYGQTGNPNLLPACIAPAVMAELPADLAQQWHHLAGDC